MNRTHLPVLLGALLLGSSAAAQDENELPYHQKQRLVMIFKVNETLNVSDMFNGGAAVEVIKKGVYRFEAERRSQSVLTAANLADGTGPFVRYGSRMRGKIRPLYGTGTTREATVSLKLTDGQLGRRNVLRAGELDVTFRVRLDSNSITQMRLQGDVTRDGSGPFVRGSLEQIQSSQTGSIDVWHVKLSLEDHLPIRRPLAQFPAQLKASVRPTPKDEIEAGPFDFTLDRKELNEVGAVTYDGSTHFPMVHEQDYYGHYQSSANRAQLVIREDEKVHVEFGWGLGGRYHGWSFTYKALLTKAQFQRLEGGQPLTVTGTASYHFSSEDGSHEVHTPARIHFSLGATPPTTSSTSSGSSSGLIGGVTGN